jgi:hypothetical protein
VVHARVYAVGHARVDPRARGHAAVLACGPKALLSHSSAAVLWGLLRRWEEPFEVTAPSERRRPRIETYICGRLTRGDRRVQLGIPATSPARTVLDITPRLTDRALLRVLSNGRHSGYLHLDSLRDVIARNPSHPGARRLGTAVEDAPENPTRSGLEDAFRAFVKRFALPMPVINSRLNGYEVDAVFHAERLIVELDGWDYHNDFEAFESDRDRDADGLLAGYSTLRITGRRLERRPEREAARILAILAGRRREPAAG